MTGVQTVLFRSWGRSAGPSRRRRRFSGRVADAFLTINALCASDSVLVTADTQMFAIVGTNELLKTVQKIKKRVNSGLKVKGILLTMCDNRTNLYKTLTEQVEEMFQGRIKVFQTKIPKTVKVGEAIYSGQSIKKYAKGSSVDVAYDNLAKEICYE